MLAEFSSNFVKSRSLGQIFEKNIFYPGKPHFVPIFMTCVLNIGVGIILILTGHGIGVKFSQGQGQI